MCILSHILIRACLSISVLAIFALLCFPWCVLYVYKITFYWFFWFLQGCVFGQNIFHNDCIYIAYLQYLSTCVKRWIAVANFCYTACIYKVSPLCVAFRCTKRVFHIKTFATKVAIIQYFSPVCDLFWINEWLKLTKMYHTVYILLDFPLCVFLHVLSKSILEKIFLTIFALIWFILGLYACMIHKRTYDTETFLAIVS